MQRSKTFFLAPTSEFLTEDQLKLGTILSDPSSPQDALNSDSVTPPPESDVMVSRLEDWKFASTDSQTLSLGIFSRWLTALTSRSKERTLEYNAEAMIRKSFHPSYEYMIKSMQSSDVSLYLQRRRRSPVLYIVTGVMVAHNARVRSSAGTTSHANLSIPPPVIIGAPFDLGPSVSASAGNGEEFVFRQHDFVFAYSLRKIVYSKSRNHLYADTYVKGAMFSTHGNLWDMDDDKTDGEVTGVDLLGIETKDPDADDLGVKSTSVIDEHTGERVESILSGEISLSTLRVAD